MPLTFGEFLRWLGLWFLMSTISGVPTREEFWLLSNVSMFYGAPFCLHSMMTKQCFNSILAALKYMDVPFLSFKDEIHEVRQLIVSFNERMTEVFNPAWVNVGVVLLCPVSHCALCA